MVGNGATIQVNTFTIIRSPYQLGAVPIGIVLVGISQRGEVIVVGELRGLSVVHHQGAQVLGTRIRGLRGRKRARTGCRHREAQ